MEASAWLRSFGEDIYEGYQIGDKRVVLYGAELSYLDDIREYEWEGDFPRNDQEVMLNESAKERLGVCTGDNVTIRTPAGDFVYRVTGFCVDEWQVYNKKYDGVTAYMSLSALDAVCTANHADCHKEAEEPAYYVRFAKGTNIRKAVAGLKERYGSGGGEIRENIVTMGTAGVSGSHAINDLYLTAAVVFVLILIAGGLMISSCLNSTVSQRIKFFGMMRCIGASKKQVMHFVRLEALNWCKTAIPAGIILGTAATWLVLAFMHRFVGGEFARMAVFGISPIGMVSGAVVGILTVLLAARAPAKKAAKVSPVAAVSGNADAGMQRPQRANTRLLKIETALGVSHAASSKKSLLLMAGSFALSIILFLSFSVLVDLLGIMLPTKSYGSDIDINLLENGELIDPDLMQEMREMPGVKNVFGRRLAAAIPAEFSVEVDRDTVDILSYDDIQLDWVPGDGDLRSGGDLKKVYGDQGYVLCIWDKDVPLDVGDTVTLGGSTVEIAGMMTNNPFSNNGRTDGDVILICSHETFGRLMGEAGYSIVCVQMAPNGTDEEAEAIHDLTRGRYQFLDRRVNIWHWN